MRSDTRGNGPHPQGAARLGPREVTAVGRDRSQSQPLINVLQAHLHLRQCLAEAKLELDRCLQTNVWAARVRSCICWTLTYWALTAWWALCWTPRSKVETRQTFLSLWRLHSNIRREKRQRSVKNIYIRARKIQVNGNYLHLDWDPGNPDLRFSCGDWKILIYFLVFCFE